MVFCSSQPGRGPGADHTNGTAKGRYAYMDTVMRTEGERARLYSQVFKASTDGKCSLRYYVSMFFQYTECKHSGFIVSGFIHA